MLVSGLIFAAKMLGFVLAALCGLAVFLLIVGKRVMRLGLEFYGSRLTEEISHGAQQVARRFLEVNLEPVNHVC